MIILYITVAFCVGTVVGKYLTDSRWSRNALVVFRLPCRGRLYKVSDVSPWQE